MEKIVIRLFAPLLCLAVSNCAKEPLNTNAGTDPDNRADSDTKTDSDKPVDSATEIDSDKDAGFDTDSDTNPNIDTCGEYEWDTNANSGDWKREIVGCYSRFYEIKIGDGRNDGVNRLYSALRDGNLLEWSFVSEDTPWKMRHCGGVTDNVDVVQKRMISIWIGPGRNDGINRVYAANVNGDTYEFSYNKSNDQWEMINIGSGNFQTGIVVGDLRNDGVTRVISTGHDIPVNEFSWNDRAWKITAVSDGPRDIWPPFIGQARNDGFNRLYCPDWGQPYLREFSWNGSSFDEDVVETAGKLVKAITGDGRNDGIQRVYASVMKGHVIEFSSDSNGNWKQLDIMEGQGENHSRYGLYLAKTHGDDTNRLYSVAQGGKLTEHTFKDTTWTNTDIDAISGATADLTVGRARNDNVNRVYVAGANGFLFEYTHSDFAE